MKFDPNPLFFKMASFYAQCRKDKTKAIILNEGSSRSSKTWDTFHLIYTICDHNRNKGLSIYILRDTLANCRDYTMKEFVDFMVSIGKYETSSHRQFPKPEYELLGNKIFFRGLDDEANTEGYPSDILFINEALETKKTKVDGLIMRCRKAIIMDWNPKFTQHWCFDMAKRPNAMITHSTYKNNKHLGQEVIDEIESLEPWEPGSYEVIENQVYYNGKPVDDNNQPPPHPVNHDYATADEFRWKVYGLGLRGAMKGLLFPSVKYVDKWPEHLDYTFGLDFGFTADPTALVRYGIEGKNIYLELLSYTPMDSPDKINLYFQEIGIERNKVITADSSDKYTGENKGTVEMVKGLYSLNWNVFKVRKTKNVMYWLISMKEHRIHIVRNHLYQHAKSEQENYKLKEVHGIAINQPIDDFNHFWDAARYAHMARFENRRVIY